MTLRHLNIFLQVCDEDGMTRAAEKMHISQPSVSQAIHELEEHYNVRLFERLGKKLFITNAGRELQEYARHIIGLTEQTESALRNFSAVSPLRVGATLSIGESIFIPFLGKFKEIMPNIPVQSRIHNTATLEEYLLRDELDIALVEGKIQSEYLKEIPFMDDELIFIDAPDGSKRHDKDEINLMSFITREEGSGTRNLFEQVMAMHQIVPKIVGVYNNSDSIKKAVAAHLGVAVLSERVVGDELAQGKLIEFKVDDIRFERNFRIVYHRNKYLTDSIKKFLEICRAV
ncbi:MAG: LysR family transcriptional regulator [Selenomonadaceae bacterium]|nr:LysR family transcriptional regulator [Selenomonadaceae bacterium]